MDTIHEETYRGCTIKIIQDDCAESPRDWDNLGEMICFHGRYKLGDKHSYTLEEAQEMEADEKNRVTLPLYLYDHSGLTMNTTGFSCPWDSGKVGIITITCKKIREEFGDCYPETIERIKGYLGGEVATYDHYLRGNVYGFQIEDEDGNEIESCYGFIGDYDDEDYGCLKEAKGIVDSHLKHLPEKMKGAGI